MWGKSGGIFTCPLSQVWCLHYGLSRRSIAALDMIADTLRSCVSLVDSDLQRLFSFKGILCSTPDPSAKFTNTLDFIVAGPYCRSKLVKLPKLAFSSHFCLTALGDAWTHRSHALADSYEIPALHDAAVVAPDDLELFGLVCWHRCVPRPSRPLSSTPPTSMASVLRPILISTILELACHALNVFRPRAASLVTLHDVH